jgi:hypothetical protein
VSQMIHEEKLEDKSGRPHDHHLVKRHQKDLICHSADVHGNVVADHGIDHQKGHHEGKYNVLKFCFWHRLFSFSLRFLKNGRKKDTCVVR